MALTTYFDFRRVWAELVVPILQDPRVVAVRMWVANELREQTLRLESSDGSAQEDFMLALKARLEGFTVQEQTQLVATYSWARFSPLDGPDDEKWYTEVTIPENDGPMKLEYYLYRHGCETIATMVWTWCSILYPAKKWAIVASANHTFVVDLADTRIMYELWWQEAGLPIEMAGGLQDGWSRFFTEPATYHATTFLDLPAWADSKTLEALADDKVVTWSRQPHPLTQVLPTATEIADYTKWRHLEVADVLHLQRVFGWTRP